MSTPEPCWAAAYGPGVTLHLEAGDTTLVDRFERTASAHPQRVALEFLGRKTTYAATADQVSRVAEGLRRLGVGPGDSVALLMPNCPQNVIAFCAVLRLGATVVEWTGSDEEPFLSEASMEEDRLLAEAAEFAGAHGLFWEMHRAIFANGHHLSGAILVALAQAHCPAKP